MAITLPLADEKATERFGHDLALALEKGDLVTLHGDLGMGKSTLARALIRTLADNEALEVPSPTFTLVQTYNDQRLPVAHADLYRISAPEEIDELGFDEALGDGVLVVEWPQKAANLLEGAQFAVFLEQDGKGRRVIVRAQKDAAARLERSLLIRRFLEKNGRGRATRRYFLGDASPRGYETVTLGTSCEFLMTMPKTPRAGKAERCYAQMVHLAAGPERFAGIDRLLRENGFATPEIHAADLAAGLLIVENLGRTGITDKKGQPIAGRYLACAELLARFHATDWPKEKSWPDLTLHIPHYDKTALHAEAALLLEWYLPHKAQTAPASALQDAFHACWDALFDRLLQAETSLVMRDFHSPNIIWRPGRKGRQRIGLLDFQDALIGPQAYDLVSLGQDARVTIAETLEKNIIARYSSARAKGFDQAAFEQAYAIAGTQRASKILGIFVRLGKRDGKPGYLRHLPRIMDYLERNLKAPVLAPLKACYLEMGIIARDR